MLVLQQARREWNMYKMVAKSFFVENKVNLLLYYRKHIFIKNYIIYCNFFEDTFLSAVRDLKTTEMFLTRLGRL